MAHSIKKSEHNGAKNGGGAWMKRIDAKKESNKVRRANDKVIELEDNRPPCQPENDEHDCYRSGCYEYNKDDWF